MFNLKSPTTEKFIGEKNCRTLGISQIEGKITVSTVVGYITKNILFLKRCK